VSGLVDEFVSSREFDLDALVKVSTVRNSIDPRRLAAATNAGSSLRPGFSLGSNSAM